MQCRCLESKILFKTEALEKMVYDPEWVLENEEELDKRSWDMGVMERSYYVTGAHMCRVIEETSGKDVFKQTLVDGPRAFFETYNGLVSEKEIIIY